MTRYAVRESHTQACPACLLLFLRTKLGISLHAYLECPGGIHALFATRSVRVSCPSDLSMRVSRSLLIFRVFSPIPNPRCPLSYLFIFSYEYDQVLFSPLFSLSLL